MKKIKVTSSTIVSFGYSQKDRILEINFKGGQTYHYFDVPKDIYDSLMKLKKAKKSIGQYFHKEIKTNYKYAKVVENELA